MKRASDYLTLAIQIALAYVFIHFGGEQNSSIFVICLAMLLTLLAITIAVKAFWDLRSSFAVAPKPHSQAKLVTSGIYSKIRHPMYSSIILISTAYLLYRYSVVTLASSFVIVLFFIIKIQVEDKMLTDQFPEYKEYKENTGSLLPFKYKTRNVEK